MDPKVKNPITVTNRLVLLFVGLGLVAVSVFVLLFKSQTTRSVVSGLVTNPAEELRTSDNRTNLVLLGIGGVGHSAPDLTDSIIFVSLNHSTHSVKLVPIPRDIWVDTMQAKVNTAYHYGLERREGGGIALAKSAVSEIVSEPVHYALVLDFQGFIKAIDALGGIDVVVERAFDDYKYPVPGKEDVFPESERYEHLRFEAGPTHLDGVTALKFARSRHAEGEEGTDFARSARQQKIILAFKDKLLETKTFLAPDTLKNVYDSFASSINTDISKDELGSFLKFFLSFEKDGQKISSYNLETFFSTPRLKTPYAGQWVLVPTNSWQEVHQYVDNSLNSQ